MPPLETATPQRAAGARIRVPSLWGTCCWLGLVSCVVGCSEPSFVTSDAEQTQHAIESGEVDDVHRSVFRVITRAGGHNALCSATLIAPNLFLTARHCVAHLDDDGVQCDTDHFAETTQPGELLFSNDTEPTLLSRWFAASTVLVNESTTLVCGNDVGLVILDENVPAKVSVPSEVRMDPIVVPNEPYVAVGYGGDMGDDATAEYGVRRSRADLVVECVGQACGVSVTNEEFGGSGGGCPGDSGGPAFDRDGRVLGALSRGHDECMSPVYSAASQFRELLLGAAQRASELGDYPLPVWAGGEPPAPAKTEDAGTPASEDDDEPKQSRHKGIAPEKTGCALRATPVQHDRTDNARVGHGATWALAFALLWLRRRQFSATSSIGTR